MNDFIDWLELAVCYLWHSQCSIRVRQVSAGGSGSFTKWQIPSAFTLLFSPHSGTCSRLCGSESALPGYTLYFNNYKKDKLFF